ncbi:MAG: YCF48-related protein [Bacteroidota bacterium]|nr:YCF48-related protein [Candidatus Kapabacteria bacterium]MDW8075892.1 YCF48-related protein [Bacteroidota bacterium]
MTQSGKIPKHYALLMIAALCVSLSAQQRQWNWEKLTLPPPYDRGFYLDVMFLPSNPQYGWACGFGGYVVRTTNGGETWEGTVIPNADQLESIIFLNERVGYCSGTNNGNPNLGGIFKSTDGGRSWREITPIVFLNGIMQRAPVWGCYFLTENLGMVVGGGCDGLPQLFFRTTDGGQTWSLFTAAEPQTGMSHVLMYSATGLCYASSSGRIWRSLDGGLTWQVFAVTGPPYWQENLAHQGNTFLVATAGTTCTGSTGSVGDIRWSFDNGRSWSRYQTNASMFGTFLVDEDAGWAVGWNRAVYRMARDRMSGEVTVIPYRCGLEPGSNYDDIWFVNDTLGYLAGDGIYRTTMRDLLQPIIVSNTGQFVVCDGQPIVLSVVKGDRVRQPYTEYIWSTGERTPTIVISRGGTYQVEVRDPDACYGKSAVVQVSEAPTPGIQLRAITPTPLCEGDTIIVEMVLDSSRVRIAEYRWLTDTSRTTRLVVVARRGVMEFRASARGVNGCEATTDVLSLTVGARPVPGVTVEKALVYSPTQDAYVLCPGDEVILTASEGYAEYRWSTGETTRSIKVREAGTYTVTVRAPGQECTGTSLPLRIVMGDTVKPSILSDRGFRFCEGDYITLSTEREYRRYRWSTGEQSSTITITQAGEYWVEVTDEYNCTGRSQPIRVEVDPNPIEVVGIGGMAWQFDTVAALVMRCDSIRVRNRGTAPLILAFAQLQRNVEFSVPLAQLPLIIPPQEERWLVVCFLPTIVGEQRDTLRIVDDSAYCKRVLTVVGICSANQYQAESQCNVQIAGNTDAFTHAGLFVVPPYPNPADGEVRFIVYGQRVEANIYDIAGTAHMPCAVLQKTGETAEVVCSTRTLPSGVYVIQLRRGFEQQAFLVTVIH